MLGTLDHALGDDADAAWGGEEEIYEGQIKVNAKINLAAIHAYSTLSFLRSSLPSLLRHAAHSISFSKTYSQIAQ